MKKETAETEVVMKSIDLRKAFPGTTGYSVSSLWRKGQFYATHSSKEFLAQAVRELGGEPTSARDSLKAVLAEALLR